MLLTNKCEFPCLLSHSLHRDFHRTLNFSLAWKNRNRKAGKFRIFQARKWGEETLKKEVLMYSSSASVYLLELFITSRPKLKEEAVTSSNRFLALCSRRVKVFFSHLRSKQTLFFKHTNGQLLLLHEKNFLSIYGEKSTKY